MLCGGFFGWHHFYLGRDKQAFIWFSTFGGFLFGLLGDLFNIPAYVREANEKIELSKDTELKLKAPIFFTSKFVRSIFVASFFGYVLKYCVPYSDDAYVYYVLFKFLSPLVIALIVYLISTEGPMKCKFKWPLLGSYIAFVFDVFCGFQTIYNSALLSTMFLNWNIEWDHEYFKNMKKRKLTKRLAYATVGCVLVMCLYGLFLWNNASIEIEGKKVTLKESVYKFLSSKELVELKEVCRMIWNYYKAHGLKKLLNHFVYGYDAEAVSNAYLVT